MNDLLSIVVPAFEEESNIRSGKLETLILVLQKLVDDWELIVVDDGSSDCTPNLVQQLSLQYDRVRLLNEPHCGKGFALLAGMQAARGEYILFTDLDQATPMSEIKKLLPWFEQGYDIVYGTRGIQRKHAPFSRKCASFGYTFWRRLIIGPIASIDTQCGFKAFTRQALHNIIDHLHVYHFDRRHPVTGSMVTPGFDVEILFVARQLGYLAKPVMVNWVYHHSGGMNLYTSSWQGFLDLLRLRFAFKRGKYNFSA